MRRYILSHEPHRSACPRNLLHIFVQELLTPGFDGEHLSKNSGELTQRIRSGHEGTYFIEENYQVAVG